MAVGQNVNTPQTTDQHKFQFRDDFTWQRGRHEWKTGVSFIYEPVLDITFNSGQSNNFTHLADSRTSPISSITRSGLISGEASASGVGKIPNNQYGFYVQDAWRATDKLTLDLGVRYDLVTGYANVQDGNIIYDELQAAGRAGLFDRNTFPCPCPGTRTSAWSRRRTRNNIAPRAGFTYDVNARRPPGPARRRRPLLRLRLHQRQPALPGGRRPGAVRAGVLGRPTADGIRNADGSLFQVGQPLPPNQLTNISAPLPSGASTPRIKQPYSDQVNLGFSKALGNALRGRGGRRLGRGHATWACAPASTRASTASRRFTGFLPSPAAPTPADVHPGRREPLSAA